MMVAMVTLMKNIMLEKVRSAGALTDSELYRSMTKDGGTMPEDRFNKMLLDLEILGLVKVVWVTKDDRRIEASEDESAQDNLQNGDSGGGGQYASDSGSAAASASQGSAEDTSYEASFPGLEK